MELNDHLLRAEHPTHPPTHVCSHGLPPCAQASHSDYMARFHMKNKPGAVRQPPFELEMLEGALIVATGAGRVARLLPQGLVAGGRGGLLWCSSAAVAPGAGGPSLQRRCS